MKIALFGATGRTGKHVLQLALAKGYDVSVLVRNADSLASVRDRLRVTIGDARDSRKVLETLDGATAVLSALGPRSNVPDFAISQSVSNIVMGMEARGIRRLVMAAGQGIEMPGDEPKLINKLVTLLLKTMARHIYEDMARAVEVVTASSLEWTVVRAPRLINGASAQPLRVGYVGRGVGTQLARSEFGRFLLDQLDDRTFVGMAPAISN